MIDLRQSESAPSGTAEWSTCPGVRVVGLQNAELPERTAERLCRLLESDVVSWRVVEGGYTPAFRWSVTLADGRAAFVKQAVELSIEPGAIVKSCG